MHSEHDLNTVQINQSSQIGYAYLSFYPKCTPIESLFIAAPVFLHALTIIQVQMNVRTITSGRNT